MNHSKPAKNNHTDFLHRSDFQYTSKNPYHSRLKVFDHFVMRDDESEAFQGKWNSHVFKNDNELVVEIGTGYGHFMMDYTQKNPSINFVGLDHRFKRSFHLAQKLNQLEHKNFRYLRARGERIQFTFGEKEIQKIFYFFPDPWPKSRHHKKRLFQKPFLDACFQTLSDNGDLYVKTDHDGYFDWMVEHVKNDDRYNIEMLTYDMYQEQPNHFLAQFQTKFERIFLKKNIKIKAMVLKKKA